MIRKEMQEWTDVQLRRVADAEAWTTGTYCRPRSSPPQRCLVGHALDVVGEVKARPDWTMFRGQLGSRSLETRFDNIVDRIAGGRVRRTLALAGSMKPSVAAAIYHAATQDAGRACSRVAREILAARALSELPTPAREEAACSAG